MSMSEVVEVLDVMEKLRDACHKNSVNHGFWDKEYNFGEKIALIHSELSEMFEAYRKGVGDKACDKDIIIIDPHYRTEHDLVGHRRITAIEEEVADVFIRLFDLCGKLNIDVGRVILAKMEYNRSRPYMHNRKC